VELQKGLAEAVEDRALGVQLVDEAVSSEEDREGGEASEETEEEADREDSLDEVDQGAGEVAGEAVAEDLEVHKTGIENWWDYSSVQFDFRISATELPTPHSLVWPTSATAGVRSFGTVVIYTKPRYLR